MRKWICLTLLFCAIASGYAESARSADQPSTSSEVQKEDASFLDYSQELFYAPSLDLPLDIRESLTRYMTNSKIQMEVLQSQNQFLTLQISEQKKFNQQSIQMYQSDLKELRTMNKLYGIISIAAILTSGIVTSIVIICN